MMRYRAFLTSVLVLCAAGCARMQPDRDTIYMTSTIHALVEALFEGEVSFGQLKHHGDLGLGAVDSVAGELVMVDGICYSAKADGSVSVLADAQKTPYALVTYYEPDRVLEFNQELDYDQLKNKLDEAFGNANLPYAFRMEGEFSYVKARSLPPQGKPYPRLIDAVKLQREFEFKNVSGVIVGFRLPPHLDSVGVPGYHCHFLTSDRKSGGHLLAFRAGKLRVGGDLSPEVHIVLPQGADFARVDFTKRNPDEINRIMGRTGSK